MKSPLLFAHPSGTRLRRAFILAILLCAAALSEAKPPFLDLFLATYKPDPTSPLGLAKCGICHTTAPKKNAYGKDVKKLLDASNNGKLTVEILRQLEPIDSDGDKWSNGEEIAAGFLPGDANSHPSGAPSKAAKPSGNATSGSAASNDSLITKLIPSNGYHPVVIHFPIALFIFGVFLEFIGIWKKIPGLATAALWNLVGALVSLAAVTPTGIAAWLIGQHKLEGTMLIHLLLAVGSLLLMSGTLVARKKLGNEARAYLAILVLTAVIVGLTGHFGGQLVYG